MQIFDFVVLSMIIAFSTVLMYEGKRAVKEKRMTLLSGGWKPNSPPRNKALRFIKWSSLS